METLTAAEARDRLGELAERVRESRSPVYLSVDGAPAGALAPLESVQALGLELAGANGVREARADWATVRRRAAEAGPQAITYRNQVAAVVLCPEHAHALTSGLPPLPEGDLVFDGTQLTVDGAPLPPGDYAVPGGSTLHVSHPEEDHQ